MLKCNSAQDDLKKSKPSYVNAALVQPAVENYPDFVVKTEREFFATSKYMREKIKTLVKLKYFAKAYFLMLGTLKITIDAEMLFLRAVCKLEMGRPWAALEDVELCLSLNSNDRDALELKNEFKKSYFEAIDLACRYMKDKKCPNERDSDLIIAGLISLRNLQEAKSTIKKFMSVYPNDMVLVTYLIDCFVMEKDFKNALELVNQAIIKNIGHHALYNARSQIYEKMHCVAYAWQDAIYAEKLIS